MPADNIRVLLVATDLQPGGLPLRLAQLALRLRDLGVHPIVTSLAPHGPVADQLEIAGVQTFACDATGPTDIACLARLARIIRRSDPDIVHASLFHANLACRLVARLDRPRPVITSTVTIERERTWHLWLEAATLGCSDVHVANSDAVARHLLTDLGLRADRLCVIRNGLDLQGIDAVTPIDGRHSGIGPGQKLIVWAGRMDPVKNLELFVEAIGLVRRPRHVRAVLLGDGPCRDKVAHLIRRRRLDGVIDMPGWAACVPAWLKAADLLLFTSLTEGSPNVVLEAMACGCPVVAADIPACRELIQDRVTGLLARPGDPESLGRACDCLLGDRSIAERLAAEARKAVRAAHDLQTIAVEWKGLYQSLLR